MIGTSINNILILALLLVISSCREETIEGSAPSKSPGLNWPSFGLTTAEYKAWLAEKDNGFVRSKQFDPLKFEALYVPSEMKAIRSLGPEAENLERRKEEAKLFSDLEFYQISISADGFRNELLNFQLKDQTEYQERVQYFGFYANQDAIMVCGNDTISCPVHTWERTYDAVNKVVLEFAFPANSLKNCESDNRVLIYTDRVFGNGPLYFRF